MVVMSSIAGTCLITGALVIMATAFFYKMFEAAGLMASVQVLTRRYHQMVAELTAIYSQHYPKNMRRKRVRGPVPTSPLLPDTDESNDLPVEVPSERGPLRTMVFDPNQNIWYRVTPSMEAFIRDFVVNSKPFPDDLQVVPSDDEHQERPVFDVIAFYSARDLGGSSHKQNSQVKQTQTNRADLGSSTD